MPNRMRSCTRKSPLPYPQRVSFTTVPPLLVTIVKLVDRQTCGVRLSLLPWRLPPALRCAHHAPSQPPSPRHLSPAARLPHRRIRLSVTSLAPSFTPVVVRPRRRLTCQIILVFLVHCSYGTLTLRPTGLRAVVPRHRSPRCGAAVALVDAAPSSAPLDEEWAAKRAEKRHLVGARLATLAVWDAHCRARTAPCTPVPHAPRTPRLRCSGPRSASFAPGAPACHTSQHPPRNARPGGAGDARAVPGAARHQRVNSDAAHRRRVRARPQAGGGVPRRPMSNAIPASAAPSVWPRLIAAD